MNSNLNIHYRTNRNPEIIKERAIRLKRLRTLLYKSVAKCSKETGISQATLNGWEQGKHGGLSYKGAVKVVNAFHRAGLDVNIHWLLTGEGRPPRLSNELFTERGN